MSKSCQIDSSLIKLNEVIGQGFFSVVHAGTYNNKKVAIKVLNSSQTPEMLERELTFNKLSHPNITQIFGYSTVNNQIYIIMEICSGGAVSDVLDALSDAQRVKILYQASLGLQYLHENDMVHRDLKVQNLLLKAPLTTKIHAKISDFGLSRKLTSDAQKNDLERTTSRYTTVGTPLLMAPEILLNDSVYNEQVDIFMFGLLILQIFRECTDPDIIRDDAFSVKNDEIQKMSLPLQLKAVVIKCCQTLPEDRLRSSELVKALKSLDGYYNDGN